MRCAAFVGGVEMALPSFAAVQGGGLAAAVGANNFDAGRKEVRWQTLIGSGCQTGQEFAAAWTSLQEAGEAAARWVVEPPESPQVPKSLQVGAVGAGGGCMSGATRKVVTDELEELQGKVLAKALRLFGDQTARPVWSWQVRDALSAQWVLSLPVGATKLSGREFQEVVATHLCLPSPACVEALGATIPGEEGLVVDAFGDRVRSARLHEDGFRERHDIIKRVLTSLAQWAKVRVRCEVFGEFAALIPQQGWAKVEQWEKGVRGRKRHGLVPDFKFPSGWGAEGEARLAELKVISCCHSHYATLLTGHEKSPVQVFADAQTSLYLGKAQKADRDFVGVPEGQQGPVEARLRGYGPITGLVFGAFGEASEAVHEFVQVVANARAAGGQGKEAGAKGEVAKLVGQVRRLLGVTAVKAQAKLLLERLQLVGQKAATPQEQVAAAAQEWQRRELEAADRALREGMRGVHRGGQPRVGVGA
jgi:hypothetical protein